jgi:protein-disulfide isomerase
VPTGVAAPDGGVAVGEESAPVTVDLWIDFQCPFCRDFELASGSTLDELVADGSARLVYHPLSFLGEESERAANAFGCSVDEGRPVEYQRALFENQPAEGTGGFTVDDLIALGEQAEVTGDAFETCVADGTYDGWVANVAASQQDAGVTATPTVVVDGQTLESEQLTPEGVRAAVEQATA